VWEEDRRDGRTRFDQEGEEGKKGRGMREVMSRRKKRVGGRRREVRADVVSVVCLVGCCCEERGLGVSLFFGRLSGSPSYFFCLERERLRDEIKMR
jgi:hypothetical protein